MAEGVVKKVVAARGFGFIEGAGEGDVFLHATALRDGLEFDEQLLGRRVRFDIEHNAKGRQAINVRPA